MGREGKKRYTTDVKESARGRDASAKALAASTGGFVDRDTAVAE